MKPLTEPGARSETFVTTHWTRVLDARGDSPDAKTALGELCVAYYAPVFSFIRRSVEDEGAAQDLTQEFFARILARQGVDTVDPARGRFRSFLLGAVKHFLAEMRDHTHRAKRGGGCTHQPLEPGTDTSPGLQVPELNVLTPDREFDRKWALTVLSRALGCLGKEQSRNGKQFEILKPWLTGDADLSQAEAGRELGLKEGAVKVAIHRLRKRFGELVKREIAETLKDPSHLKDELACLMAALSTTH